jgi:hypothetical protein
MDGLHQLLADARGELPPNTVDLDQISARGRKIIRRRRWSVVAAAVAVTLAAGSLLPLVRRDHHPSPPGLPASTAPAFAARVQGFSSGGYDVGASIMVTPGYEVAPISYAGHAVGSLEVYRPGAFDPHVFQAGTPLTPGYLHVDTVTVRYDDGRLLATINKTALAWPYADDAWAVLRSAAAGPADGLSAPTLQQLASHLTLGAPAPVRLPFHLGYTPPGLVPSAADLSRDTTPGRLGELTLAPPRPYTGLTGPVTPSGVTVVEEREPTGTHHGGTACDSDGCYRGLPGTNRYVGVTGKLPTAQLRRVLDSLTTADPSRPATWYPL